MKNVVTKGTRRTGLKLRVSLAQSGTAHDVQMMARMASVKAMILVGGGGEKSECGRWGSERKGLAVHGTGMFRRGGWHNHHTVCIWCPTHMHVPARAFPPRPAPTQSLPHPRVSTNLSDSCSLPIRPLTRMLFCMPKVLNWGNMESLAARCRSGASIVLACGGLLLSLLPRRRKNPPLRVPGNRRLADRTGASSCTNVLCVGMG